MNTKEMQLPVVVGKTKNGKEIVKNLAKHNFLFAGKPCSGKTKIASDIVRYAKEKETDTKVVLVDIKNVEAELYSNIDEVITYHPDAKKMLYDMCDEMDKRFDMLYQAGVRNISEYNALEGKRINRLVIVIDEYADLIMMFGNEFESPLMRLAQKANYVGIHLIMTTMVTLDTVITGLIKSNFTTLYCEKECIVCDCDTRDYEN